MIDLGDQRSHHNPKAEQVDEVGVTNLIKDGKNAITGWSFIFPLEPFRDPKYEVQAKNVFSNELFGRIVHRSALKPGQVSGSCIVTLESQ
jgi:hypothetical protein